MITVTVGAKWTWPSESNDVAAKLCDLGVSRTKLGTAHMTRVGTPQWYIAFTVFCSCVVLLFCIFCFLLFGFLFCVVSVFFCFHYFIIYIVFEGVLPKFCATMRTTSAPTFTATASCGGNSWRARSRLLRWIQCEWSHLSRLKDCDCQFQVRLFYYWFYLNN